MKGEKGTRWARKWCSGRERRALYDFLMMHEMREQHKGAPVSLDDSHKHRRELAANMVENWHKFLLDYGADERTWAKRTAEELEAMQTKMAGWIQECEGELAARPSPQGRETIVNAWKSGLERKNKEIKAVMDQKRAVT